MSALRQRDAADATNKTMAMRYELSAVLREIWTSRALVPGACVFAYIVASLLIVVMNKVVLDTYQFPSTTIILRTLLGFGQDDTSRHPAVMSYWCDQKYQQTQGDSVRPFSHTGHDAA